MSVRSKLRTNFIVLLLCIVALSSLVQPAGVRAEAAQEEAWDIFDDNMDDFTVNWEVASSAGVVTQQNGYVNIQDDLANKYTYIKKKDFLPPSGAFVFEIRTKINAEGTGEYTIKGGQYVIGMYLTYGTEGMVKSALNNPLKTYTLDTTVFHDYKIVMHADYTYDLYVDGVQVWSNVPNLGGSGSIIKIGADNGPITNMDIDSIKMGNTDESIPYDPELDDVLDRYGQFKNVDFPEKITSDQQVSDTVQWEQNYYNSLQTPVNRDVYGGLIGSKEQFGLTETGFFHIERLNEKSVLVDPLGNLHFVLGVNGAGAVGDTYTQVAGREHIYQWLPEYNESDPFYSAYRPGSSDNFSYFLANRIRKYGQPFDPIEFNEETKTRLEKWGFNSAGGFSDAWFMDQMPMATISRMPAKMSGIDAWDVFKPTFEQELEEAVRPGAEAKRDNPMFLGYYLGNELHWYKLRGFIPGQKASEVASKGKLVDMAKEKYGNDISAFNEAWQKDYASFGEVYESTTLSIMTDEAEKDFNLFLVEYFDTFYRLASQKIRKYDPNHMIIGDRFFTGTANDIALVNIILEQSGKYLDVISYNYYTYDLDLDRLREMYEIAGKPLLLTEFHYGEPTRGHLNSLRTLENAEDKGLAYRDYVESAAASGFIVGTNWFEYLDEAATGRWFTGYGGENYAIGLVDVTDRPYLPVVSAMKDTNDRIYDVLLGNEEPYQFEFYSSDKPADQLIRIAKANTPIVVDGVMEDAWPETETAHIHDLHRVIGVFEPGVEADVRFAWDQNNLYMVAHIQDNTPMTNARAASSNWNGDAIELFIGPQEDKIDDAGSIKPLDSQLILSGGIVDGQSRYYWYNGRFDQSPVQLVNKLDADNKGYTMEAAIPLSSLYIDNPGDGRMLRFDIGLDDGAVTGGRQRQYIWNGVDGNAFMRSRWGKAVMVDASDDFASVSLTGSASIAAGAPLALTYRLSGVTSDVYAKSVTFSYDPELLEYVSADELTDTFQIVGDSVRPGTVKILEAATNANSPITGSIDLLTLNFRALSPAQSVYASVYMSDVVIGDRYGNESTVSSDSYYRAEIQVLPVDKTALNIALVDSEAFAAKASLQTSETLWRHYKKSDVDAFKAIVAEAKALVNRSDLSQAEIDQAVIDLTAANQALWNSANSNVNIGDLGMMAANYDATSDSGDWVKIEMYDINVNHVIDLSDLAQLARQILNE